MPFQFLFARAEDPAHDNQWQCAFNLATDLGFTNAEKTFATIVAANDPVTMRGLYQVVYVAPGLSPTDYGYLQQMVAPGGVIEQFVSLGGVAVINVAGVPDQVYTVAPSADLVNPVGFSSQTQHDSETIAMTNHPYIQGISFGGSTLGTADFSGWGPTDLGTLTNLPADANVVLSNSGLPTWAEYRYGAGRVIVTTLRYCWDPAPDPSHLHPAEFLSPSQWDAAANLLLYSRFFTGSAWTPAPTVTPSGSPTRTPTPRPSRTPTRTYTPTVTSTPIATSTPAVPTPTPSVTLIDVIGAIFGDSNPFVADVNRDKDVTAADVPALVQLLQ